MNKTEMELKILREKKGKWYYNKGKGKMASRREKSTSFFCNLEKGITLKKNYSNLILDNGIETSVQNVIQSELQLFYKTLYSSTEPIINESHVVKCEGHLTFQ
jgi:hypothetical protein